ncbi:MAG TPA: nucleotide exchange factor GrpE [Dehalococcoidia bacterium]|nr:nucleotide exchange factor GrpE [Dehalococcoidia bacterium]
MIPRDPDIEPTDKEDIEPEEPETLEQALAAEKKRAEEYLANWQRAQADFVNLKRRSEQERGDIIKTANAELAYSILPVLDDLARALEHSDSTDSPTVDEGWVEGIRLIERKLRAGLESQGVREIEALGEKFDPNLHEAAMHSKGPEGIVIQEIQKGYMLHDRVLRPSMVVVGNGETGPGDIAGADEED